MMFKTIGWVALLCCALTGCGTDSPQTTQRSLEVVPGCVPMDRWCEAGGDGAVLGLRLGPDVKALAPFAVRARVQVPQEVRRIVVDFAMPGMDMGVNRYRLEPAYDGLWYGQVTLPICSTGRLDWVAELKVETAGAVYGARFPFSTGS